jgi:hypothetical protein
MPGVREDHQEKGTPELRALRTFHVLRVRGRWRDFSTAHPCADEKRRASCTPPCGFFHHRPPLRMGPLQSGASMRQEPKPSVACVALRSSRSSCLPLPLPLPSPFAFALARRSARLWRGPARCGGGRRKQPEGWPTGCRPSFRRHTDVPSKRPAARNVPCAQGCAQGATPRGALLLVIFSWASKRSHPAAEADGTALQQRECSPSARRL